MYAEGVRGVCFYIALSLPQNGNKNFKSISNKLNYKKCVFPILKATVEGVGNADYKSATSIYDFTVTDIDGNQVSLEKYR